MAGTEDKVEGQFDQAKGRIKEEAGKATDDKSLQAEGLADRAKGKVKETVGDAKDALDGDDDDNR